MAQTLIADFVALPAALWLASGERPETAVTRYPASSSSSCANDSGMPS